MRQSARAMVDRYNLLVREKQKEIDALSVESLGSQRPSARREAMKQLALEHGLTVSTMRNKMTRARAAAEALEEKEDPGSYTNVDLITFGLPVPASWMRRMAEIRLDLLSLAHVLRVQLTKVPRSEYPRGYTVGLQDSINTLLNRIARALPVGLCPYCKGCDPYQNDCAECDRTGVATHSVMETAPEELKGSPLMVKHKGKTIRL